MKYGLGFGAVALLAASAALAEGVKPSDVVYDDGAIAVSLSGQPGDPAAGAEIMNKGAGNCIACHQVSDLDHLAFQGDDRWSAEELRGIVANAKIMFPDSMMPSFYKTEGFTRLGDGYTGKAHPEGEVQPLLTAQQIEDVVAYLQTLTYE